MAFRKLTDCAWPCIVAMACLSALASADTAPAIAWTTDYSAALERAKTEHKPVLIDFTAEWCGWCKRLDDEVYSDASAANALKDYVCVKVDVDKQTNVALAYNVQSMPRTVVINVNDEIVGDQTGYMPLGSFLEFLSGLKDDLSRKTGGTAKPEVRAGAVRSEPKKPAITADTPADELIAHLGDRELSVREEALQIIRDKPDKFAILVAALGNDALCTRVTAYETLRKSDGPNIAFDPWAPKTDRDKALGEWRQWVGKQNPDETAVTKPQGET